MAKILVADDDRLTRRLIEICLRGAGHSVVVATNGQQAVELMRLQAIDLVLMDMNMPELDGWTAACLIKEEFQNRVPVVAITSYGLPADKARAAAAGCTCFLSKPIDAELLLTTIAKALKLSSEK